MNFSEEKVHHRVQLYKNKVYILQTILKTKSTMIFVLTWDKIKPDDHSGDKFKNQPILKAIKLEKYYTDFYLDRLGKFNFLKRYKGLYALEITTDPNISKVDSKKLIRLRVPNSAEAGSKFIETGYGTFVIQSPTYHLSVVARYNKRISVKSIPKAEYPKDPSILSKLIMVQTKDLFYYIYLYKSYKTKEDPNPVDGDSDSDDGDASADLIIPGLADLPHIQVYHKNSKILQKHRMRKFKAGRVVSLSAGYKTHFAHNRLIVSQLRSQDEDGNTIPSEQRTTRFFKIFNNFLQGYLRCRPIKIAEREKIRKAHKADPTNVDPYKSLRLKVKTDGFIYRLEIRFGEEPLYYHQVHHLHSYNQYAYNPHTIDGLQNDGSDEGIQHLEDASFVPPESQEENPTKIDVEIPDPDTSNSSGDKTGQEVDSSEEPEGTNDDDDNGFSETPKRKHQDQGNSTIYTIF
jgi:hypothetical protein